MNKDRFLDVIEMVKNNFEVEDQGRVELEEEPGEVEYIIFKGPLGRIKLEGITKPVVENKEVVYSKRMGTSAVEKKIYSETEKMFAFRPYKWSEELNDWQEIDAENLELS